MLCQRGIRHVSETDADELWVIPDMSDLRKPYAREMAGLMKVRDLDGELLPRYRTMSVVGMTPLRHGFLYHRLFTSQEEEFLSDSPEVQRALERVSEALPKVKPRMTMSWIMDSRFDHVVVWRTI